MVICLKRDADLHVAQLMPLPLTISCFSKIQIPEKGPLNGCVCVFTCTLEIFLLVGICLYVSDSVV